LPARGQNVENSGGLLEIESTTDKNQDKPQGLDNGVLIEGCAVRTVQTRLSQAHMLRTQFLSNMSHELRTPLTTIVGFTSVLLDQASGPLSVEQHKQLELIQSAGTQLLELINDLLDLTRIQARRHRAPAAARSQSRLTTSLSARHTRSRYVSWPSAHPAR